MVWKPPILDIWAKYNTMKFLKILSLLLLVGSVDLACEKEEETNDDGASITLPAAISGSSYNLVCSFAANDAPALLNDQALFSFGSDGSLSIDFDPAANNGAEVSLSNGTMVNSEFVWEDSDAGYKYALSLTANDSLNEVDVFDLQDNFLNQWTPIPDGPSNLALVTALAGTYNVQSVNQGTHSRMTLIIGSDGAIDFDSGISFTTEDYQLITDRIDVLDAIFIDITPYPNDPYPRLELFVDPNDASQLQSVIYRPNYPNSGATEISF